MCCAAFTAILGCMRPAGHRLDTDGDVRISALTEVWKTSIPILPDDFEEFKILVKEVTPNVVKIARELELKVEPWLVWLRVLSAGLRTKGSPVQFPVRAHAWVVGQVPSIGCVRGAITH